VYVVDKTRQSMGHEGTEAGIDGGEGLAACSHQVEAGASVDRRYTMAVGNAVHKAAYGR
jgi:hypothetical protein